MTRFGTLTFFASIFVLGYSCPNAVASQECSVFVAGSDVRANREAENATELANLTMFVALAGLEQIHPDLCARTIKSLADCGTCIDPLLPSLLPFLKSKHTKIRYATVTCVLATKNQVVVPPILELIKKEDSAFVIDESLRVFFVFEGNKKLESAVEALLTKSQTINVSAQSKGATAEDVLFFGWSPVERIESRFKDRIASAIAKAGPGCIPVLERKLKDKKGEWQIKALSVVALGRVFEREMTSNGNGVEKTAGKLLPLLLEQLDSDKESMQIVTLRAIEHVAIAAGKKVPELASVSDDLRRTDVVRAIAKDASLHIELRLSEKK